MLASFPTSSIGRACLLLDVPTSSLTLTSFRPPCRLLPSSRPPYHLLMLSRPPHVLASSQPPCMSQPPCLLLNSQVVPPSIRLLCKSYHPHFPSSDHLPASPPSPHPEKLEARSESPKVELDMVWARVWEGGLKAGLGPEKWLLSLGLSTASPD